MQRQDDEQLRPSRSPSGKDATGDDRPAGFFGAVSAVVAAVLLLRCACQVGATEPLGARLPVEAQQAWKHYRQQFEQWKRSLSGTVTSVGKRTAPVERLLWDWEMEILTRDDCSRVVAPRQLYVDPDGSVRRKGREVYCLNPDYAFALTTSTAENGHPRLRVSRLERTATATSLPFRLRMILGCLKWASLVDLPMVGLPELFAEPAFRVVSIDRQGEEVVVEFALDGNEDRHWGMTSGKLVLDPQHDWCLRRAESKVFLEGGWVDVVQTFEPVSSGYGDLLVSRHTRVDYRAPHYGGFEDYLLNVRRNATPVSDEEFRLSAFGLPEPALGRTKRLTFATWLVVCNAALLAVVLTVLCVAWRRRRCRKQTEPVPRERVE